MDEKRLDKIVAGAGLISRTEAKELIRSGRVTIDGIPCRRGEQKVNPETQTIAVSGEVIHYRPYLTIMLYKPAGVVSATEDRQERTAVSLLPEPIQRTGIFPAGRLDKDTEGFLLMTTNGSLAHRITSPAHHVEKEYLVETDKPATLEDRAAFLEGIRLSEEECCRPAVLSLTEEPCRSHLILREGKFHQVKRMMEARGKTVLYLKRIRIGPISLDENLRPGEWRMLTEEEEHALKHATELE